MSTAIRFNACIMIYHASVVKWSAHLVMNLKAWVLIPVWAVSVQLTQLFIVSLINGYLGKVNVVTWMLHLPCILG